MEKEDRMKMEVVVDGVSKRYGKVEALQDVSFSVKRTLSCPIRSDKPEQFTTLHRERDIL